MINFFFVLLFSAKAWGEAFLEDGMEFEYEGEMYQNTGSITPPLLSYCIVLSRNHGLCSSCRCPSLEVQDEDAGRGKQHPRAAL